MTVRALRISMALMASIGTLLLGLGQESIFLPTLTILAASLSVVLTDELKLFRLNRNVANLAAVGAVVYAVSDFSQLESDMKLLAIANLLIYLQIVLLFQEKSLRVYWQLCILSLLQVVVSAALNSGVGFGAMLFVYLLVALVAMTLLLIYRESYRFTHQGNAEAAQPFEGKLRFWPKSSDTETPNRWSAKLAADAPDTLLGKRFVIQIATMSIVTVLITVLTFYFVPRRNKKPWNAQGSRHRSVTGFSQEVSLNSMGRILQSDEEAMRVKFIDAATGEPYHVLEEPYIRGTVLNHYSPQRGLWRNFNTIPITQEIPKIDRSRARVLQEITLERSVHAGQGRSDELMLFSTAPVQRVDESPADVRLDLFAQQLLIERTKIPDDGPRFRYVLATSAFQRGQQRQYLPDVDTYLPLQRQRTLTYWPQRPDGSEPLRPIRQLATQVVNDAGVDEDDHHRMALALNDYFQTPGLFEYSLDPDVERQKNTDPIEDFLINHRTGHCEYFASALVLMLRSQGIASRMVVGFKGGDVNRVASYYLVRQRNAHAWVEVYLPPGKYPAEVVDPSARRRGVWMRLDPTPPDFTQDQEFNRGGIWAHVNDSIDYAQLLWNDYVLAMNSERQWHGIYRPLKSWLLAFIADLRRGDFRSWLIRLATICALLLVMLIVRRMIWRWRNPTSLKRSTAKPSRLRQQLDWVASWFKRGPLGDHQLPRPTVEFYRRLETLMAAQGLTRQPHQTQREFAMAAGGVLADSPALAPVSGLPRRIVESFYRVRFGGSALDKAEIDAVEHALTELEIALGNTETS